MANLPSGHPNYGILDNLDVDKAIADIASGKLMHQIASELGCSKGAIRHKIMSHPGYADAIQAQAESLVDQTTAELMDVAADQVLITRARARNDSAHKWAAARDPARWSTGTRIMGADGGPLQVEIVRYSAPVTLDAELAPAPLLGKVSTD